MPWSQDDGDPNPLHCAQLGGRWHHGQLPREGSGWQLCVQSWLLLTIWHQSLLRALAQRKPSECGAAPCAGGERGRGGESSHRLPGMCPLESFEGCGLGTPFLLPSKPRSYPKADLFPRLSSLQLFSCQVQATIGEGGSATLGTVPAALPAWPWLPETDLLLRRKG